MSCEAKDLRRQRPPPLRDLQKLGASKFGHEGQRTSENQFILFVLSLLIWLDQKSDPTFSISPIPRLGPEGIRMTSETRTLIRSRYTNSASNTATQWYTSKRHFQKSRMQNAGMRVPVSRSIWQARPALPGPILGNGVEFRFTIEYNLNSFFCCCWHANMKKRSKLLNPRAAVCLSPPFFRQPEQTGSRLAAVAASVQRPPFAI